MSELIQQTLWGAASAWVNDETWEAMHACRWSGLAFFHCTALPAPGIPAITNCSSRPSTLPPGDLAASRVAADVGGWSGVAQRRLVLTHKGLLERRPGDYEVGCAVLLAGAAQPANAVELGDAVCCRAHPLNC